MKKYNVAVLGATGAVGQEMMKILEERSFPIAELRPLASARSAGKTVTFRGQAVKVQEACDSAFEGIDIVLGAAENDIAEKLAPAIVKGSRVKVAKGAKTYNGGSLASYVYTTTYTVIQIDGSRVVIGINGVVTAAVNIKDLTLVG